MVLAGMAIFFAGIALSSSVYFATRPFRFADAVLSNFLSADDNPRGYLAAAVGTVIAALLLAPAARIFFVRLGAIHKAGSLAATMLYSAGLLAAILIGCLAPVRGLDFSIHLVLAYASFLSLQAGISIYLTIAAYEPGRSRRMRVFAAVEWALAVLLVVLSFGPDWTGSVAFCEAGLCATIAAGLWVLTGLANPVP